MQSDKSSAAAMLHLVNQPHRAGNRYLRATDIFSRKISAEIGKTPYEIVYTEDRLRLKYYRPEKQTVKTPLLLVYALINRETMLDLEPERSVIRNLLRGGVEIYMVDWGTPTRKDRFLTIDDHVNGYIDRLVDVICRRHRISMVNMMGVCMGGTFITMYSALHPEKVRNLITSVTPIQFDTDKGLLHRWMKELDADALVDSMGNVSGDFLNMAFLMLNPSRLVIEKYKNFFDHIDDAPFLETFLRMEKWIFDSPDVPGETFRQYAKDCYQKNLLIQNKMELGGKKIDLKRITMPVLNFYGQEDHLVPPEASIPFIENIGTLDGENVAIPTGHIGIYVSSRAQQEFVPRIVRWLQERDPQENKRKKRLQIPSSSDLQP